LLHPSSLHLFIFYLFRRLFAIALLVWIEQSSLLVSVPP